MGILLVKGLPAVQRRILSERSGGDIFLQTRFSRKRVSRALERAHLSNNMYIWKYFISNIQRALTSRRLKRAMRQTVGLPPQHQNLDPRPESSSRKDRLYHTTSSTHKNGTEEMYGYFPTVKQISVSLTVIHSHIIP